MLISQKLRLKIMCVCFVTEQRKLLTICDTVKKFWSKLNKNIELNFGIQYTASPFEILFGITSNVSHEHTINILYLVAKSYIFKLFNGILIQLHFTSPFSSCSDHCLFTQDCISNFFGIILWYSVDMICINPIQYWGEGRKTPPCGFLSVVFSVANFSTSFSDF